MESTTLPKEQFGSLWKYIEDDNITDIDWDSNQLWIKQTSGERKKVEDNEINEKFIHDFSYAVANNDGKSFNPSDPFLEAESERLRFTFVHEFRSMNGRAMSIRKSLDKLRYTPSDMLKNRFCDIDTLSLLINCILAKRNFAICGEPGKGKTELSKFLSSFIPKNQRVITIEDIQEWYYDRINPGASCIPIKVRDYTEYADAIKSALRLNPSWIMLAEARSKEVKYLLESWSTGVKGITTLHVDDLNKVPDRIINMMENAEYSVINNVYMFLNIGVLVKEIVDKEGNSYRRIDQVYFYWREKDVNKYVSVVENGVMYKERMPDGLRKKLEKDADTHDIFYCKTLEEGMCEE